MQYADAVDVWGIGCILLEAVTLQFLWERKGMLAGQVLTDPVRADKLPTEFPLQLREVIAASLSASSSLPLHLTFPPSPSPSPSPSLACL